MAEPSLSITRNTLFQRVGDYLGFGKGSTAQSNGGDTTWSTYQLAEVTFCVDSGIRLFYNTPEIHQKHPGGHNWSFKRPKVTFQLLSGKRRIDLPGDFAGLVGEIHLSVSGQSGYIPVRSYNDMQIDELYARSPDATGTPQYVAEEYLKEFRPSEGQAARLYFYPQADQTYSCKFSYVFNPHALSSTYPYPLGGSEHSQTILMACLAFAEQHKYNSRGINWQMFVEQLLASIRLDENKRAHRLGYNGNGDSERYSEPVNSQGYTVTFNGTEYD